MRLTIKQWWIMKNNDIRIRLAKIFYLPGAWGVCFQLAKDDDEYRTLIPRFIMGAHPGLGTGLLSLFCLGLLMGALFLFRRLFGVIKKTQTS